MTTEFEQAVLRQISLDGNSVGVVPVSRAALGLVAVLRSWKNNCDSYIVALPAAVCHDVVAAVLEAGCLPFFCDVDPADGLVMEKEWLRARDAGAVAAIVVHLYGNAADVEAVRNIFPSPECLVIDDAAQALGSKYGISEAGSKGDVGLISFGTTKHISVGGAAVLIAENGLLERTRETIETIHYSTANSIREAEKKFRTDFENARENLWEHDDHTRFTGLLNGYDSALYPSPSSINFDDAANALKLYSQAARERQYKASIWRDQLHGCGLLPVGMGEGVVPWRYTCRLPGLSWSEQHCLGDAMRAAGLNVSHWYMPATWFLEETSSKTLPGTEILSREVFQFWIDDQTTVEDIKYGSTVVSSIINQYLSKRL